MAEHKLIVGLGNPGPKYARNRHNIGFMVVDELARRLDLEFRAGDRTFLVAEADGLSLLKPLTYMNLSGEAVTAWAAAQARSVTGQPPFVPEVEATEPEAGRDPELEARPEPTLEPVLPPGIRPLVVVDDLALPLGTVRLRARGSSGGQNGLESLIAELQGEEFPRLRLGIAPQGEAIAPEAWPDFVLADFASEDGDLVAEVVDHAAAALEFWLENGLEPTVSRFNRRVRPGS